MTVKVVLSVKQQDKGFGPYVVVKRGNKIEAKIFPPNKYHPHQYQIEMNGLAFHRDLLDTALEFVRKSVEDFHNAFSNDYSFTLEKK